VKLNVFMSAVHDIEKGKRLDTGAGLEPSEGFGAVAGWIAGDRDDETFIFRKVDDLGARNLLYMQCEMLLLRKRLAAYDRKVAREDADIDLKEAARSWEVLAEQCSDDNEDAKAHMRLVKELRGMIREYCASGPSI